MIQRIPTRRPRRVRIISFTIFVGLSLTGWLLYQLR